MEDKKSSKKNCMDTNHRKQNMYRLKAEQHKTGPTKKPVSKEMPSDLFASQKWCIPQ